MKSKSLFILMVLILTIAPNALASDEIAISYPYAHKSKRYFGSSGYKGPEGITLSLGCFVEGIGYPIKEVFIKNLNSGVILSAKQWPTDDVYKNLFEVTPPPIFNETKHMGIWQVTVRDELKNQSISTTHNLNIKDELPFITDIKVSGNPLAPKIKWKPVNKKEVPEGIGVAYNVRLLYDTDYYFYRSKLLFKTKHKIPKGYIDQKKYDKIYIKVQCLGFDINDKEHIWPQEIVSITYLLLKEAFDK